MAAAKDMVQDWYKTYLGRAPGEQGLNFWAGQLGGGEVKPSAGLNQTFDAFRASALSNGEAWQPNPARAGADGGLLGGVPNVTDQGDPGPILRENRAPRAPALNPPSIERPEAPTAPPQATRFAPGRFTAERYDPTLRDVDPETETVESRYARLTGADSALMRDARTRGFETAASRGLLNSSVSAAAAEREARQAALPIAQQDASTYTNQGLQNQAFQNRAGEFGAGESNEIIRAEQAYENARGLSDQESLQAQARADQAAGIAERQSGQDFREQEALLAQEGAIKEGLSQLDNNLAIELERIRTENQELVNNRAEAGSVYREGINSIGNLLTNSALSPEQQRAAMDVILGQTEAALEFMSGVQNA